jgi:hypothetical protein
MCRRLVLTLSVGLAALALAAPAHATDWYARGSFYEASDELGVSGAWGADSGNLLLDDGTGGDAVAGDGILSRAIATNVPAGVYEFKVGTLTWSSGFPDGYNINLRVRLTEADQEALVTFDTNMYDDGWLPVTHMIWSDRLVQPDIGWYVVGDIAELGSWAPAFGLEAELQPSGIYLAHTYIGTTGPIEYKWTADLAWIIQEVNGQGYCIRDMSHNVPFTVTDAGDYDFGMNPATGRVKAGPAGTVPTEDVSWSRIKTLYVDPR